jgi:hypothetical protein
MVTIAEPATTINIEGTSINAPMSSIAEKIKPKAPKRPTIVAISIKFPRSYAICSLKTPRYRPVSRIGSVCSGNHYPSRLPAGSLKIDSRSTIISVSGVISLRQGPTMQPNFNYSRS